MGCGASTKGPLPTAGDRRIFKLHDSNQKLKNIYQDIVDDDPVVVTKVDNESWPIQIRFVKTGKTSPCQPNDLLPVPEGYEWPEEVQPAGARAAPAATPAAQPAAAPAAPKAAAAPKAVAAPKAAAASAPAPGPKVEAMPDPEEEKVDESLTYKTKDGITYKWDFSGSSLVLYGDEKMFCVVKPENGDKFSIVLDAGEMQVKLDYDDGKSSLSNHQTWGKFCVHQMLPGDMVKLKKWLDNFEAPYEERSLKEMAEQFEKAERAKAEAALTNVTAEYKEATCAAHNAHRNSEVWYREEVGELEWDDECYILAKMQAEECSRKKICVNGNLNGSKGKYGQNLWQRFSGWAYPDPEVCTDQWAISEDAYDYKNPGPQKGCRSFAQVVWKDTKYVAMAKSECGNFMVAMYFPAGPLGDNPDYKTNVVPKTFYEQEDDDPNYDAGADVDQAGCMAAARLIDKHGNVRMT